ncbi:MAG: glycosyltransferase [Chloroflexia bacterium]
MKILYVNKIQPLGGGGAELRLWEIARTLAARGHDVHIVCGKHLPNLPDEEVRDGVTIHAVQILPEWMFRFHMLSFFLSRYGFYLRSTIPIIREVQRADVVVDVASPIVSFAGPACTRMGKPCVLVLHETFGRQWFKLKGPVTATLGYLAEFVLFSRTYDGYIILQRDSTQPRVPASVPSIYTSSTPTWAYRGSFARPPTTPGGGARSCASADS